MGPRAQTPKKSKQTKRKDPRSRLQVDRQPGLAEQMAKAGERHLTDTEFAQSFGALPADEEG